MAARRNDAVHAVHNVTKHSGSAKSHGGRPTNAEHSRPSLIDPHTPPAASIEVGGDSGIASPQKTTAAHSALSHSALAHTTK